MTYSFDLQRSLVVVPVFVAGPRGGEYFDFAVDIGATRTCVSGPLLEMLGYRRDQTRGRFQARTGSGGIETGTISVRSFLTFGILRSDYPVVWMPLPPASRVEGLLGLDFFRGRILKVDFIRGRVSLDLPRRWWQLWR